MAALSVQPLTAPALAQQVADRALAAAARTGGGCVRVGVDGCVPDDARALADAVATAVAATGTATGRVDDGDFLLPRGQRLEHGARDPDVAWETWVDVGALRREVLDPLAPGGSLSWLPSLRDPLTDRSVRVPRRTAPPGSVVVLAGRFLLRPELAGGLDLVVHLQTSPDAQRRRLLDDDERARAVPAWQRYLRECDPASLADLVVRHDHPDRPALIT